MSNAVKFTEPGSITLNARRENGDIHVAVIDTGIGIAEDALSIIFDRFQQAQRDMDQKYGGPGLRLDICKQLCQMHATDLIVENVVGRCSTFNFTLPLSTPEKL